MEIIRARAPVRIDLVGGGSDAPPFSIEHGGAVVNLGITRYAVCRIERGPEIQGVEIVSNDLQESVRADTVRQLEYDGRLDLLKAVLRHGGIDGPLRLVTDVDAPPQSGLGASSSLCVSVLAACALATGRDWGPAELAERAHRAEREELGMAGGKQDQYGGAFGRVVHYEFSSAGVTPRPLELPPARLAELEHRLVLAYTGVTHLSENIHSDIKRDYADADSPCKQAMFALARLGREAAGVVESGDPHRLAALLNQNWRYHKDLHASCTNPALDRLHEIAAAHGALGGKTCGAGGGGCVVFVCAEGRRRELEQILREEGCQLMPFSIDREGALAWRVVS